MRKPAHLQAAGKLTVRDRIWAAIRALDKSSMPPSTGSFALGDIADQCIADAPLEAKVRRIDEKTIESYLQGLEAAGYLRVIEASRQRDGKGKWRADRYALARDVGIEAPRVDRKGGEVQMGAGTENLWRSMKVLKAFDWRELRAAAAIVIAPATAKTYCHMLARAGYLKVLRPAKPGTPASYRLIKNTGPRAPQIQRVKHVYDPNLGQVVWHPEVNS